MGWSSGTRVFDAVVGLLLNDKPIEEKIEELILELEGMDWDSVCVRAIGMTTLLFMVLFVNYIQGGLRRTRNEKVSTRYRDKRWEVSCGCFWKAYRSV